MQYVAERFTADEADPDKFRLEIGIGGRLDVGHPPRVVYRLITLVTIEQRDARSIARGVPDGHHPIQRTVRDQSQYHRIFRIDITAERPGEDDSLDL